MYSRPSYPNMSDHEDDDDDDDDGDDEDDLESLPGGAFLEEDPSRRDALSTVNSSVVKYSTVASSTTNDSSKIGSYGWQVQETRVKPKPKPAGKWAKIRVSLNTQSLNTQNPIEITHLF